jgi:hypothetical protein
VRVAREHFRGKHDVLHGHAVHTDEATPEIVKGHAVLRAAIDILDLQRVGMEAHIRGHLQRRSLGMRGAGDLSTA